jgi:hypothetical protein
MALPGTRRTRVAVAALLQLALVGAAVAGPLSARATGEEYLLDVAPVDPIDPFRGAYVALSYPGLPGSPVPMEPPPGHEGEGESVEMSEPAEPPRAPGEPGQVFVPLERHGDVWRGGTPVRERPSEGPYLRCDDGRWQLRCGIESYFVGQERALELERAVVDGDAVARVRVDGRGNAALVAVETRSSS